jgi:formylglycine-generating enzyme required for sulfatase activity
VGSHPTGASPYGALDMAGNVWEWVSDWYDGDYYSVSPYKNPQGPETGAYKVLRGGSWYSGWSSVRAAYRSYGDPMLLGSRVGFRCAAPPGE